MRSMALRLRWRTGEKQFFHRLFAFGGMFGIVPALWLPPGKRALWPAD
jgi:hypothetical protein